MKKIIGILVLVLFNTIVFGQTYYFHHISVFHKDYHLDDYRKGDIPPLHYWFEANNKKYVLAYDVDENNYNNARYVGDTRNLILYRFDGVNNWVKASNVVQVDYEKSEAYIDYGTHKSYGRHESKIIKRGLGNGSINILESGCVVMFITNTFSKPDKVHTFSQKTKTYTCCDGHKNGVRNPSYDYNAVVILVPNGDNTYTATRFEPEDKRNNDFTPELKIIESENQIKIDVFTFHSITDKSEKGDTVVVRTTERDEKISTSYYSTLVFDIQQDKTVKVLTSGKLNLIKKL